LLSTVISNIVKYIIENKDKTKLNTALSEYVSKDIADEILSWEWNINLEWDKKRIAIFFSDIEWFTTISESFSPEKLISFLKDYLSEMSEIIFSNKWFVNKYEWDAIMALRWVFEKEPGNISKSACDTALLQKQRLIEFNEKWTKKWLPLIKVRIWINTWEAIIWNIWYIWKKLEFTAIWDNVNLASRLESINKFYSTYICVSESVYNETKDLFEYRYLDKIKVKWKNIALNIYELLSNKWKLKKKEKDIYTKFWKWITFYLNRDFDKALELFVELSELWDPPSFIYKERCLTYIKNPPLDNWDKVWTMTEK
jgi:adenylate cyclase